MNETLTKTMRDLVGPQHTCPTCRGEGKLRQPPEKAPAKVPVPWSVYGAVGIPTWMLVVVKGINFAFSEVITNEAGAVIVGLAALGGLIGGIVGIDTYVTEKKARGA